MPSSTVPKTLLSAVFLTLIGIASADARDAVQVYRFGGWTLIAPASVDPASLASGAPPWRVPAEGLELLAYWQDGSQRAVALRFDGGDSKNDSVVVKSAQGSSRLKGCKLGTSARLPALKQSLPKVATAIVFPDEGLLQLSGSNRSLRRNGEALVADMGGARVQLIEDSPIVRKGEWDSADFCRIELNPVSEPDDDTPY